MSAPNSEAIDFADLGLRIHNGGPVTEGTWIRDTQLSKRTKRALSRARILTVGEMRALTLEAALSIKGIGMVSLREIADVGGMKAHWEAERKRDAAEMEKRITNLAWALKYLREEIGGKTRRTADLLGIVTAKIEMLRRTADVLSAPLILRPLSVAETIADDEDFCLPEPIGCREEI